MNFLGLGKLFLKWKTKKANVCTLDKYAIATSEFAYTMGIEAREALEDARQIIADSLGAEKKELIFTSGATEANNLALKKLWMVVFRNRI